MKIDDLDWPALTGTLDSHGFAVTDPLLGPEDCAAVAALFDDDRLFRKRVDMGRHNYGRGRYAYFADPLPEPVAALREGLYARLAPVANGWMAAVGEKSRYPDDLAGFRARCAEGGQPHPTPLLLRYGPGDYNRLHRDLYGPLTFPLQATVLLDRPGEDFTGGEFLLVENRARQQAAGTVVPLNQGAAVIFATDTRPAQGARGPVRAHLRHGVSEVRSGRRRALGIIFHDAR